MCLYQRDVKKFIDVVPISSDEFFQVLGAASQEGALPAQFIAEAIREKLARHEVRQVLGQARHVVGLTQDEVVRICTALGTGHSPIPPGDHDSIEAFTKKAVLKEANRVCYSRWPMLDLENAVDKAVAMIEIQSGRLNDLNEMRGDPSTIDDNRDVFETGLSKIADAVVDELRSAFNAAFDYAGGEAESAAHAQ